MGKTIEYNWKLALFTSLVLTFGGLFISLINYSNYIYKDSIEYNWSVWFGLVTPVLFIISFAPLIFCNVVNKIKSKKNISK